MKKFIILGFLLVSAAVIGCSKSNENNNNNNAQTPQYCNQNGVNYCAQYNTTAYPYNPCVNGNNSYNGNNYGCAGNAWNYSGYNSNWYSYGCPAGYMPVQNNVVGSGMTCVHYLFFQNFYGSQNLYFAANYNWGNGGMGVGPAQACDTYTANSCGTANGLRCVSYNTRYGFCTL